MDRTLSFPAETDLDSETAYLDALEDYLDDLADGAPDAPAPARQATRWLPALRALRRRK
jgi:hypothetical protein